MLCLGVEILLHHFPLLLFPFQWAQLIFVRTLEWKNHGWRSSWDYHWNNCKGAIPQAALSLCNNAVWVYLHIKGQDWFQELPELGHVAAWDWRWNSSDVKIKNEIKYIDWLIQINQFSRCYNTVGFLLFHWFRMCYLLQREKKVWYTQ
jgi:hypothetical protein